MDVKQQDERFAARQAALGCATSIKFLVVLLVLAGLVVVGLVLQSGSGNEMLATALFCFATLSGLAAILWGVGQVMVWQARIEENTGAAADALEQLAGKPRDPTLSDLTPRDIEPPGEKADD